MFNVEEGNIESLIEKIKEYYSIDGISPDVQLENNFISVSIQNSNVFPNQNKYNLLIKSCENKEFNVAYPLVCELAEEYPSNSEIYRIKGQIESEMGQVDNAINSLIDALRWDSKNTYALIMMGNVFAKEKKDIDTALKYYEQASISDPEDYLSLNNIGANLLNLGKYSQAKAFFEKAEKLNPKYPNTKYGLAYVYFEEKKYNEAFQYVLETFRLINENDNLYKLTLSLSSDIAKKLNEQDLVNELFHRAIKEAENLTGKEIRIEEDDSITTTAKVELAESYNRNFHLIKYKKNSPGVLHLILHEIQHIELAEMARLADNNFLFISTNEQRLRFKSDYESFAITLQKKGLPIESINKVINSLFDGLNRQVFNTPIDLFIEDNLFIKYPELRPIQFISFYSILMEGRTSVTRKEIIELFDSKILSKSKIYNLVLANHFKELYKIDILKTFNGSKIENNTAESMYSEFLEYRNDKEPGEEYELVQNWGNDLNLSKYFSLVPEKEYLSSKFENSDFLDLTDNDEDTDANQKIEMHEFLENHKNKDLNLAVLMYMIGALEYFQNMSHEQIKKVAFQIATIGMNGINPENKDGYHVPLIPNSNFSGYQMLAYYYVSFALSSPQILPELQLPFDKEYESAKTFLK